MDCGCVCRPVTSSLSKKLVVEWSEGTFLKNWWKQTSLKHERPFLLPLPLPWEKEEKRPITFLPSSTYGSEELRLTWTVLRNLDRVSSFLNCCLITKGSPTQLGRQSHSAWSKTQMATLKRKKGYHVRHGLNRLNYKHVMRIKRRINWTKIKLNIYNRVKSTNLLPSFAFHQKHRLRDRQSQWKNSHIHANRVTDCQDSKIAFIAYYWCLLHLIAFCSHPKAIHVASWDYTQNVHPLNVPSTTTKPQCHESNPGTIDSQRVIVFFKNHATPILEPGSTHPRAEPFLLRIWGRNKLLDCLGMDMLNFGEMFRTFPREFVQLPVLWGTGW